VQLPVLPHVPAAAAGQKPFCSGLPASTGEQVPFATLVSCCEHAWHSAAQGALQQKPVAQNVLEHSFPIMHVDPCPFLDAQVPVAPGFTQ
jgi:hypothetical protein